MTRDIVLAGGFAVMVAIMAAIWRRCHVAAICKASAMRFWERLHARQLSEITELRRDMDGCLRILDHVCTAGSGGASRQMDYARSVLDEIGRRGCSS